MTIQISIQASGDANLPPVINASGSEDSPISDDEMKTFELDNNLQLREALAEYHGKKPNHAYLRSPTPPLGDIYTQFDFDPVDRHLGVLSTEILEVTSEPLIMKSQIFENDSNTVSAVFDVAISDTVSNTSTSTWNTGGTFTVGQAFTYKVKVLGVEAGAETSFSYSQSWGIGGEHSQSVTVGSASSVHVELGPKEKVLVELSANRGVVRARINYMVYLWGRVAAHYDPKYKDHYFWFFPVQVFQKKVGLPQVFYPTETIELGYYSQSKIVVKDVDTGKVKLSRSLAAPATSA